MPNLIVYYAHPGHDRSQANAAMFAAAQQLDGVTCVDLYRDYPRFDIDPDKEQQRLIDHDTVLFQFPFFWYSTPSIVKEWMDIVLEHGFAYGSGGDKLAGKRMALAITAAGPQDAYSTTGYQHHEMRDFLRPQEQTANLCKMTFLPPYVLFASLKAPTTGGIEPHVDGYTRLLKGLAAGAFDSHKTTPHEVWTAETLPVLEGV